MDQLKRECSSYARYLTGQAPIEYVVEKYKDFHRKSDALACLNTDPFDRFLVEVSARGPHWACLVDSYASRFLKESVVRKKLVLTLALLECTPPTFEKLDATNRGGVAGAILRLGFGAICYAGQVLLAVVLFVPLRAGFSLRRKARPAAVLEP
jgi:hypothetical protein